MLGDGLSGLVPNFQGTDDPALVVGVELFGGLRVDPLQVLPQAGKTALLGDLLETLPLTAFRPEGREGAAGAEGVDVLAGAPHQDGDLAPGQDVIHASGGLLHIPGHAVIVAGVGNGHHVVGDALHLFGGGTGRADGHIPVDLHGVGGDHLTPQGLGQGDT